MIEAEFVPFLLIAVAIGFCLGWLAFYRYMSVANKQEEHRWRKVLEHAEIEKAQLEKEKATLEKELLEKR